MRCRNCGAEIPEGQLICPSCHMEVQIVPDYDPLQDVLAREVKGSVEYATRPIDSQDLRRYRSREERENDYATRVLNQGEYRSSTRVLSQGEMSRIRSQYTRTPSSSRYGGGTTSVRGTGYAPGNPETGYTRRSNPWEGDYVRRDSGYAARGTAGGFVRETGYTGRNAGNPARESGYTGRNTGNPVRESGYTGRNLGNSGRESGYARRDAANSGWENGYAGRDPVGSVRESGFSRRDTGNHPRETGYDRGASEARRGTGNIRRENSGSQYTGNLRQDPEGRRQGTGEIRDPQERRRLKRERKKRSAKKRFQKMVTVFCVILILCAAVGFLLYQNSYAGAVGKGQKALQTGDYSAAETYFERALKKDVKKPDAYAGLAKVYIQQKNLEKAEGVFIAAIDSQPENGDLYEAAIRFYIESEQPEKISPLLEGCDSAVLSRVSDYVSEAPVFSLDEGSYQEVQETSLTGEGTIYFTEDGSTPDESSTEYTEPILLSEGTTVLKAVCINKKGIPSLVSTRTYTVELQGEGAPAVTPSTGKYSAPFQITIQVPEGYTAYYTADGTTPSAASQMYGGPIDVTEGDGSLIFSAVLISDTGKMTPVTKRNYTLQFE